MYIKKFVKIRYARSYFNNNNIDYREYSNRAYVAIYAATGAFVLRASGAFSASLPGPGENK